MSSLGFHSGTGCSGSQPYYSPGQPYQWVAARDGNVPPGAVKGGRDGVHDLYVGRAHHNDELIPGKIFPKHKVCYVAHGGKEHAKTNYQVLCGNNLTWVPCSGSNIPPGAVIGGGCNEGGELLYIGRALQGGSRVIGKVHPSHQVCYIPYGGKEHAHKSYEILISSSGNGLTATTHYQAMAMPPMMTAPAMTMPMPATMFPPSSASNPGGIYPFLQQPVLYSPVQWLPYHSGSIPQGAFVAGRTSHNNLYIGRAHHLNDVIPGEVNPFQRSCTVAWGGKSHSKNDFQILCGTNLAWVPSYGGSIPTNALPGGNTSQGETLYIGRVNHNGKQTIGKVHVSHKVCYIPYQGKENGHSSYEVLVAFT